ncbi:hypothetical protein [Zoogloea sp.]|uniref:hypothetical protein n=1 Tax=Zoogloea sp. TaxID=49181 RepID=UPI002BF4E44C|nr:hypothetical protein [Zoogloea sp.]
MLRSPHNQFLVTLEPEGSNAATGKTETTKVDKIREQAITRIKGLHQAYPDMQQFADQLIAGFQK